jgi:hypothetical protein
MTFGIDVKYTIITGPNPYWQGANNGNLFSLMGQIGFKL